MAVGSCIAYMQTAAHAAAAADFWAPSLLWEWQGNADEAMHAFGLGA